MGSIKLIIVFCVSFFGVYSCNQSEWFQESQRKMDEYNAAQKIPHLVREADGCKVYAFENENRTHYFTRCPNSITSTESSHTVSCGKNCTTVETETIGVGK